MQMDEREARNVIARAKEGTQQREFKGANWSLHFKMNELQRSVWRGLRQLPNLKEIDDSEFARLVDMYHSAQLIGSASCEHVDGIKFVRYARVFMDCVGYSAGRGMAMVAVPRDDNDWAASQHGRVPLKLRHWSFHVCDHKYERVEYRNCVTTYKCSECGWMHEVDSS